MILCIKKTFFIKNSNDKIGTKISLMANEKNWLFSMPFLSIKNNASNVENNFSMKSLVSFNSSVRNFWKFSLDLHSRFDNLSDSTNRLIVSRLIFDVLNVRLASLIIFLSFDKFLIVNQGHYSDNNWNEINAIWSRIGFRGEYHATVYRG